MHKKKKKSAKHKRSILKNVLTVFFVRSMKAKGGQNNIVPHWVSLYGEREKKGIFRNIFWEQLEGE